VAISCWPSAARASRMASTMPKAELIIQACPRD
jgi:hypothetical protein